LINFYNSQSKRTCPEGLTVKLPNYEKAVVSETKITGYLLSIKHREGRSKAEFFTQLGFTADAWEELVSALLRHVAENEVAKMEDSPFGKRYIVEGELFGSGGRKAIIRSVWFVETGEDIPRFVTAYPLQRRI
jgi:hypothetical protein